MTCARRRLNLKTLTLTFQASLITSTTQHWKRTKVLAGQMWTLIFQGSLITGTTLQWKQTRVLAGQMWTCDLESLTCLLSAGWASTRSDKTIGWCTIERRKTLPKAWGKSLPKGLTTSPKGGDPQVYWRTSYPPHRGRVEIFFTLNQAYWVKQATERKCFYNE